MALVASGAVLASVAGSASGATPPDGDLAYLRVLIGAELLSSDFHARAIAGGRLSADQVALLRHILADDKAHYAGLAQLVAGAGGTPATADDIDFSYPDGAFDSAGSIAKAALDIETISLGAYLGAVQNVQTASLRLPIGQIAGNEAQHVGALSPWVGKPVVGRAFAPAWPIGVVSDALDAYES